MELKDEIEKLREELYKSISDRGIDIEETIEMSKKLDNLINGMKDIPNKKQNNYDIAYEKLKKLTKDFGEFPTVKGWNKYAKENNLLSSSSMQYISGFNWNKLRAKILSEI